MAAEDREKKLAAFGQVEMLPQRQAAIKELIMQANDADVPQPARERQTARARRAWGTWAAGAAGLLLVAGGLYVASNTIMSHQRHLKHVVIGGVIPLLGRQMHIPTLKEVKSAEVNPNFPGVNILHLSPNTPSGRQTIAQLLRWLSESQPDGFETNHRWPNLGPTTLNIYTKDRTIQVTEAWEPDGPALRRSNDYVVLYPTKGGKPIHLYSPQLAKWLYSGWNAGTTRTSRYSALSNVPPSMLAKFKQELQKAPIQNIMLPTNLPFAVASVTEQNIGGGAQIVLSNPQHTLGIDVFPNSNNESVTKFATLPNEKITSLSDGSTALFGYNDRFSELAWANNGAQYSLASTNAQHKADLSKQQLISVADSFR